MAFRHVEKPYKTCRKWMILRSPEFMKLGEKLHRLEQSLFQLEQTGTSKLEQGVNWNKLEQDPGIRPWLEQRLLEQGYRESRIALLALILFQFWLVPLTLIDGHQIDKFSGTSPRLVPALFQQARSKPNKLGSRARRVASASGAGRARA